MELTCDCVDAVLVDTWAYTFYSRPSTRTIDNDEAKTYPVIIVECLPRL